MIGFRSPGKKRTSDEGERPFWISFADLMTALMVLFLVASTSSLIAASSGKGARDQEIKEFLDEIAKLAEKNSIGMDGSSLQFKDKATFASDSDLLSAESQENVRVFVPKILTTVRAMKGGHWIKHIVAEGFADTDGKYLHNLDLSMRRSQRVLCALLVIPQADKEASVLSKDDLLMVRKLFLAGGSSFNSPRADKQASRRVEMKFEFFEMGELPEKTSEATLDESYTCPLDDHCKRRECGK